MTPAIETHDLRKNYAGENALAGLSLTVPGGSLFALIGADGAGKTTLLRILATLLTPEEGKASVLGFDTLAEYGEIRGRIGYMPQRFSLYEDLSVRENMLFFADVFGMKGQDRTNRIERLLEFSRLGPFQNRRAGHLSGGMKQKLALSCALVHTPPLLLLDEPTTGVDPVSRKEFWLILKDLKSEGITILVSTPYMDEAEYADQILILHQGRALLQGAPGALVGGYPDRLYRISSSKGRMRSPPAQNLPRHVLLAYPAAGGISIVSDLAPEQNRELLAAVQESIPEADLVTQARPRLEDLFFHALAFGSVRSQNKADSPDG